MASEGSEVLVNTSGTSVAKEVECAIRRGVSQRNDILEEVKSKTNTTSNDIHLNHVIEVNLGILQRKGVVVRTGQSFKLTFAGSTTTEEKIIDICTMFGNRGSTKADIVNGVVKKYNFLRKCQVIQVFRKMALDNKLVFADQNSIKEQNVVDLLYEALKAGSPQGVRRSYLLEYVVRNKKTPVSHLNAIYNEINFLLSESYIEIGGDWDLAVSLATGIESEILKITDAGESNRKARIWTAYETAENNNLFVIDYDALDSC